MKLQPASKKQLSRIAAGSSICAVIEIAAFVVLHFCGIGHFSYRIILGTLGGTLIAIVNFALMCLMVQTAAATQDEKLRKAKVQGSYNLRLFVQAAWVVAAFFIPFINVIAAAIPLLFPTAVIYFLQITGRLMPEEELSAPAQESAPKAEDSEEENPDDENPEDNLNSFEV